MRRLVEALLGLSISSSTRKPRASWPARCGESLWSRAEMFRPGSDTTGRSSATDWESIRLQVALGGAGHRRDKRADSGRDQRLRASAILISS